MMKIGLIPNINKDTDLAAVKRTAEIFKNKCELLTPKKISEHIPYASATDDIGLIKNSDILLVFGGDGTFLDAARRSAPYFKPMLGINLGRLGFLTEVEQDCLEQASEKILSGDYSIEERIMLTASVIRNGKTVAEFQALNDVVIHSSLSRMVHLRVEVDGSLLDEYSADGIIVATPTGSTAYSLSAGGPIIHPYVEALLLTPICPHTLHSRSIVLPSSCNIAISLEHAARFGATITLDGQDGMNLCAKDIINVAKSPYLSQIIRLKNFDFFELLRLKLS